MSRALNVYESRRVNMHGTKSGPNADPDYAEKYHPGSGSIKSLPVEDRLEGFINDYLSSTDPKDPTLPDSMWRTHRKYPVDMLLDIHPRLDLIYVSALESRDPMSPEPYGTMVLQEGLDLADKWNVRLMMQPISYDPNSYDDIYVEDHYLGWEDLQAWYLKQGFVWDGLKMVYEPGSRG